MPEILLTVEKLHDWIRHPRRARVQRRTVRTVISAASHQDDRGPHWRLEPPCRLLNEDVIPAIGRRVTHTFAGEQVAFQRYTRETAYVALVFRGSDGNTYRGQSTW